MDKCFRALTLLMWCGLFVSAGVQGAQTVRISGLVYTFNTPSTVAGATVSVAEDPSISTLSDEQGRFSLEVPDESLVTLVTSMPGYRTMYSQTFEPEGADLQNVFIQFVPEPVYQLLAGMLGVDPNGPLCNVVSTVSVDAIQGMSFADFLAYTSEHGGHGHEGAIVTAKPDLTGGPIYFNELVLPDPSRAVTSRDGGVLYVNVPPGRYKLSARQSGSKYASIHIACEPGRFINASPPWGLAQKDIPAARDERTSRSSDQRRDCTLEQ